MIIDSSAWIEFLRGGRSKVGLAVRHAVADGTTVLMTTDIIRLEVLAGADGAAARENLTAMLDGCEDVPQLPQIDVDLAVDLFHECRRRGATVRAPNDCLIAAVAVRADVPVLHGDRDFDVLAAHTRLRIVTA